MNVPSATQNLRRSEKLREFPKSDTSAEFEVRKILETFASYDLHVRSQQEIKTPYHIHPFRVDFILGRDLIIEVHADHTAKWHTSRRIEKDEAKVHCLLEDGWKILEIIGIAPRIRRHAEFIREEIIRMIDKREKYKLLDFTASDGIPIVSRKPP